MTTSAQPTRPNPTQQKPYGEFAHGPVAAAINSFLVTLFFTTMGKFLGLDPWVPLTGATVMAVCLVWAGRHREPRPLSRASLIYRGTAMMIAGGWSWWQLAQFPAPDMNDTQLSVMAVAWPVTIAVVYTAVAAGQLPAMLRLVAASIVTLFTTMLTAVMWRPVAGWLAVVLFDTDRLPWGPAHLADNAAWLAKSALSLIVITAALTVLGVVFGNRERSADEELARAERAAAPTAAVNSPQAQQMRKMFCDLTGDYTDRQAADGTKMKIPNLRILDVRPWDNGAGETYIFDLTGTKKHTTRQSMRAFCDNIATKLDLPEGCGVEVNSERGMSRGKAMVDVARVNILDRELPYPPIRPRSIMNPLPVGKTRSGKEIGPYFRESSAFVWGQRGSGKSVTIFDIIAGGLQCTDCLVWVIDLNGGAAAAPFLQGWHDGRVDRPCVDWVATTMDEVADMAEVGKKIALDRKKYYRKLKRQQDTNLMPVGNGQGDNPPPEILIVIDEGKTILGSKDLDDDTKRAQKALMDIMDLARDAAVNIVFSGLRATSDVADPAFKAGTSIRIGMRVMDYQELAYGFGDYNLDPAETPYAGSGFICVGHEESSIQVFKGYFLKPSQMEEIGVEVTPWRPYLDARSLGTAGRIYAERWLRTARAIWEDPPDRVRTYGAGPAPVGGGATSSESTGTATAVMDRPEVDGFDISAGLAPPIGGDEGFAGMMRNAQRNVEEDRQKRRDAAAGRTGDAGQQPPTTPGGDQQAGGGDDGLDDDDRAERARIRTQAEFDAELRRIEQNMKVLPADPGQWPTAPVPPDAELMAMGNRSRMILERLVLTRGPLGWNEMHALLIKGGDWGPAVPISAVAMGKLLKKPGKDPVTGKDSKEPVEWLLPRKRSEPYDHKDRLK